MLLFACPLKRDGGDRVVNKLKGYLSMCGITQSKLAEILKIGRWEVNTSINRRAFNDNEKKIISKLIMDKLPNISEKDIWD